jgi:hypothetical protein
VAIPLYAASLHNLTVPEALENDRPGRCEPMSALGHKRTNVTAKAMSAFTPKADIERRVWHVRFVPKADSCSAAISTRLGSILKSLVSSRRFRAAAP